MTGVSSFFSSTRGKVATRGASSTEIHGDSASDVVRAIPKAGRWIPGRSGMFGNTRRAVTVPGGPSADASTSSRTAGGNSPAAFLGSRGAGPAVSEGGLGRAYGGEGVPRTRANNTTKTKTAAATRIGETLSALPLSKIKIVIGKLVSNTVCVRRSTKHRVSNFYPHKSFPAQDGLSELYFHSRIVVETRRITPVFSLGVMAVKPSKMRGDTQTK